MAKETKEIGKLDASDMGRRGTFKSTKGSGWDVEAYGPLEQIRHIMDETILTIGRATFSVQAAYRNETVEFDY
jgi:hypothetical protein